MIFSFDQRRALAARATGVFERIARASASASPAPDAAAALAAWNQAFAPGDGDAFARRLAWDGLTPAFVTAATALPDVDDDALAWTGWLDRFGDAASGVAHDLRTGDLAELATPDEREPPFVEIWIAVLRAARPALDARLSSTPLLTVPARESLERQLLRELSAHGELALAELFKEHVGAGRYRAFILETLEAGLAPLWTAFPVLARHAVVVVERWIDATEELIRRLSEDRARIAAALAGAVDPGDITAIDPGLSDPHDGRRRVSIVHFSSGLRVVYKPRDVRVERAFSELVAWLAAHGLSPSVPAPRVVERDGYGWVEFVAQQPFGDAEAVRHYYRQAGALLLLTHVLGSKDLHMENLVATRHGPVLIDLEMLLQPAGEPSGDIDVQRSILRTGLLSIVEIGADDEAYDVGGLRGGGATPLAVPRREWRHLRSDAVAFAGEIVVNPAVINAVVLDGRPQAAEAYAAEVLEGFTRAYEFVLAHRDEMQAVDGPLAAFAGGSVRVIARPTNQYALLSAVRHAPRYQRDGLVRSVVLDVLFRPVNAARERPREWPILVEERRAIEALDVPRFVVPAGGRTVYSAGLAILDNAYRRSPLETVHDRLRGLSRDDCTAQRRALGRALGESTATRFTTAAPSRDDDFVGHAEWIGRELLARATESNGQLVWIDGALDHAAAHHLYDGTLGPALFFSALASTTGDKAWRRAAHSALAPALAWAESKGDGQPMVIGGCSGLGSIVYGLGTAGALLDDDRALRVASCAARWIDADAIAADRRLDVVDGAAGAVLGVLALHASTRDPALLDIARCCARHMIAAHVEATPGWAWPGDRGRRIVGFAHGAAGIATALLRLSAVVECVAFRDAAVKALAFVAGAFAPGDASWPIAVSDADDDIGAGTSRMNAWCHGAPGIALAAAAALDIAPEVAILTQARAAVDRFARWDAGQADHLCCGHLGRADVLLTAGVRLAGGHAGDVATQLGARVVERARRQRHFRLSTAGFEYRVVDAGLFRGLSGIGYELLRLAAPERLPSILSFEPVGSERT